MLLQSVCKPSSEKVYKPDCAIRCQLHASSLQNRLEGLALRAGRDSLCRWTPVMFFNLFLNFTIYAKFLTSDLNCICNQEKYTQCFPDSVRDVTEAGVAAHRRREKGKHP